MTLRLERAGLDEVPWTDLDAHPDATVSQTRAWLDFLAETQGAEPVAARVLDGETAVGWFRGAVVSRFGVRILGSPLRGWTTAAMGFDLDPGTDRAAAVDALAAFAFGELRCWHVEVADRALTSEDAARTGLHPEELPGWQLDLQRPDDELLAGMNQMARRNIRKGQRNGVRIESVDPLAPGDFAAEYHAQAVDAFGKRNRRPPYGPERAAALIRHLGPTGNLVLLRAVLPDGTSGATAILPGLPGSTAEYWVGASYRASHRLFPNELLMWEAMRHWRALGATTFDFGGGGPYKAKFGGDPHSLVRLHVSRAGVIDQARKLAVAADRQRRLFLARRN
ncbi:MAG: GNAT family N-acetyltransferase [Aquihabitans sp.]